jgi:hypothetical protein
MALIITILHHLVAVAPNLLLSSLHLPLALLVRCYEIVASNFRFYLF